MLERRLKGLYLQVFCRVWMVISQHPQPLQQKVGQEMDKNIQEITNIQLFVEIMFNQLCLHDFICIQSNYFQFQPKIMKEIQNAQQTCPLCREILYSHIVPRISFPCKHIFHGKCVKKWKKERSEIGFKILDQCPICTVQFLPAIFQGDSSQTIIIKQTNSDDKKIQKKQPEKLVENQQCFLGSKICFYYYLIIAFLILVCLLSIVLFIIVDHQWINLPLVSIQYNAGGIVAIGYRTKGIFCIGVINSGIFCLGVVSFGVISISILGIGLGYICAIIGLGFGLGNFIFGCATYVCYGFAGVGFWRFKGGVGYSLLYPSLTKKKKKNKEGQCYQCHQAISIHSPRNFQMFKTGCGHYFHTSCYTWKKAYHQIRYCPIQYQQLIEDGYVNKDGLKIRMVQEEKWFYCSCYCFFYYLLLLLTISIPVVVIWIYLYNYKFIYQLKNYPFISISYRSEGWISIGVYAKGIFCVGVFSTGLFNFGVFCLGLVSAGIVNIGLIYVCGVIGIGVGFGHCLLIIATYVNYSLIGIGIWKVRKSYNQNMEIFGSYFY